MRRHRLYESDHTLMRLTHTIHNTVSQENYTTDVYERADLIRDCPFFTPICAMLPLPLPVPVCRIMHLMHKQIPWYSIPGKPHLGGRKSFFLCGTTIKSQYRVSRISMGQVFSVTVSLLALFSLSSRSERTIGSSSSPSAAPPVFGTGGLAPAPVGWCEGTEGVNAPGLKVSSGGCCCWYWPILTSGGPGNMLGGMALYGR
jgi:hypothetical protein